MGQITRCNAVDLPEQYKYKKNKKYKSQPKIG